MPAKYEHQWRAATGHKKKLVEYEILREVILVPSDMIPPEQQRKERKKTRKPKAEPEKVKIHVFRKDVLDKRYAGKDIGYKEFSFKPHHTIARVIEKVTKMKGDDAIGYALSEVHELGDGEWKKGTTFKYGTKKAKQTLEELQWTSRRGKKLPPIWVHVHSASILKSVH